VSCFEKIGGASLCGRRVYLPGFSAAVLGLLALQLLP